MNSDPVLDSGSVLSSLLPSLILGVVFYVYVAITLRVMARKRGLSGAWMAWVPIANLLLMCRIAGKSGAWTLGLLIPFVNLIVGAYIWANMAKAMGKSGAMGVLILVPIVNFFIPAVVAAGTPPGRSAAASTAPAGSAATRAGSAAGEEAQGNRPARCPHCGTPAEPGDVFCGECGHPVTTGREPEPQPEEPVAQPKKSNAGVVVAAVVLLLLLAGGWYAYANVLGYDAPERQAPALPARVAGAMTEFPVDVDQADPGIPATVITQEVEAGDDLNVPADWMPPGVTLPPEAKAITSTRYVTPSGKAPVAVHVVESGNAERTEGGISRDVERSTGGERTGVQVESPKGQVYRGSKIQTLGEIIYVLANLLTDRVIIIYTSDPSSFDVATRLASSVGNGEGLNDYPQVRDALSTLPATPPPDLRLTEANTYNRGDFEQSFSEIESIAADAGSPELRQLVDQVRRLFPQRITTARYLDGARGEWNAGVGEFGSSLKAWTTWMALRSVVSLSGDMVQPLPTGDGVSADFDEGRMVFYRKGPYIVVLTAPNGASLDRLLGLSSTLQL